MSNFGIFEFSWLNRARSEAERNNSGRALRQLAIYNASQIQKFFPKLHNVVRKIIFSIVNDFGVGTIASLRHPTPFSSYAVSPDGNGWMPTFSDETTPLHRCLAWRDLPQLLNVTKLLDALCSKTNNDAKKL
jgi:hypothetical protein